MRREQRTKMIEMIRSYENAIKLHCYECMCGQKKTDCEIEDCPLYLLRPFGRRKTSMRTKIK